MHLLDFSFQCIFKCIHKYSTQEEAKKHCTMKIMKVFVNLYFSDFEPIFWRFQVRYTKCLFYKKRLTDANTTNMFFGFFSLKLCAKFWNSMIRIHGKIFSQKWPLLTPLCSGPKMHGLHLSDFFSNVCFQMCPQIVGSRGDKVKSKWVLKLPARERMQSHIACITFSVVYFQIFLQIACFR